jgi:hypothetical protein
LSLQDPGAPWNTILETVVQGILQLGKDKKFKIMVVTIYASVPKRRKRFLTANKNQAASCFFARIYDITSQKILLFVFLVIRYAVDNRWHIVFSEHV